MSIIFRIILIASLILFESCFSLSYNIINPCKSADFLNNLDKISTEELAKIKDNLKNKNYDQSDQEGCQAAILARINLAQGNLGEASRYFSIAAAKLPELSDYFMLAKAFAELRSTYYLQARTIAHALLNSHSALGSAHFRARIQQVLAEVAFKEKDHRHVIKTHEELLSKGYGDQEALLFNLATSLSIMGEHKKSDDIFRQLLMRFPSSNQAEQALKLQNFSEIHLDIKQNEMRFDKLIANLSFDRVVLDVDKELKKKANKNFENTSALHGFAIKALMLNNQFEKAHTRARSLVHSKNAQDKNFESYAWALSKVDRSIQAADNYTRMSQCSKDQLTKAKGCFFAGFSLYEASFYSLAQLSWQGCAQTMHNTAYHEKYLWYQALSSMLMYDSKSAEHFLEQILSIFNKSPDRDKYIYFLAYTRQQLFKKDLAHQSFVKLASQSKPTYYSLLAREAIGLKPPRGKAVAATALVEKAARCKSEECKRAFNLYHLGFSDEARDVILTSSLPNEEKIALLQSIGLYHDAWQRSYTLDPEFYIKNNIIYSKASIRSSYPLPHQEIINKMSRKYSVQKSLLYAVIRAESGFLHDAKSYRGALGLMQMMPFVAHDLASKLALDKFSHESLKDPKIAIELGALLLASLKRQFDNTHLVVAAYNAGALHVQRWVDLFGHLENELFIERIPFEQTREYTKKVLLSESHYGALSGLPLKLML